MYISIYSTVDFFISCDLLPKFDFSAHSSGIWSAELEKIGVKFSAFIFTYFLQNGGHQFLVASKF